MTDIDIKTEAPAEKPGDTTGLELFRKVSTPLTREELAQLLAKLDSGWNPLAERPPAKPRTAFREPEMPDNKSLADQIFDWIDETLLENVHLLPRALADAALLEFLNPPCPTEELLAFFRAFTEAYERMLRIRIELMSPLTNAANHSITSLSLACQKQEIVRLRLDRLAAMTVKSPESADLFRLTEFAGCTAPEVAKYLSLPEPETLRQVKNRRFDICGSTSSI